MRRRIFPVLFSGSALQYGTPQTLTLQPDGTDGIDTWIDSANPNTNKATDTVTYSTLLSAGRKLRQLIKFNLSTIPAGSLVDSATLTFYAPNGNAVAASSVYRSLVAWTEAATWNTKDGTNPWTGSAGCSTPDVDYVSTATGTMAGTAVTAGNPRNITLTAADVQAMLTANNGFLIKADDETTAIAQSFGYSSDRGTAGERPKLVVVYRSPL